MAGARLTAAGFFFCSYLLQNVLQIIKNAVSVTKMWYIIKIKIHF